MQINLWGLIWLALSLLVVYASPERWRNIPYYLVVASIFLGLGIQQTFLFPQNAILLACFFYALAIYILIEYDLRTAHDFILSQTLD